MKNQHILIYSVGELDREVNLRCSKFPDVKSGLIKLLQKMLHEVSPYIKDLKTALDKVPASCNLFKNVIHTEKINLRNTETFQRTLNK